MRFQHSNDVLGLAVSGDVSLANLLLATILQINGSGVKILGMDCVKCELFCYNSRCCVKINGCDSSYEMYCLSGSYLRDLSNSSRISGLRTSFHNSCMVSALSVLLLYSIASLNASFKSGPIITSCSPVVQLITALTNIAEIAVSACGFSGVGLCGGSACAPGIAAVFVGDNGKFIAVAKRS